MALIDCPECGVKVSDKAAACPACGYVISEIVCEECGKIMKKGTTVCPSCGCPVNASADNIPAPAAPAAVPAPKKSSKKIVFILIAVIVVLIAAAAVVFLKFYNKPVKDEPSGIAENTEIREDLRVDEVSDDTVNDSGEMTAQEAIDVLNSNAKLVYTSISTNLVQISIANNELTDSKIEGQDLDIIAGGSAFENPENYLGTDYFGYIYGECDPSKYSVYYVLWSEFPIPDEYKRYIYADEQEELFNNGILIGCYGEKPESDTSAAAETTAADSNEMTQVENQEFTFKIALHNYDPDTGKYDGFTENVMNGYYTGGWRNGKPNGGGTFGQIYDDRGTTVTGLWADGQLDSFADVSYKTYSVSDTSSYSYSYTGNTGGLEASGGTGEWVEIWNDNVCRSYTGECKAASPTGNGEMIIYGNIFDEMFDDGSYIVETGEFYDGSFVNGTYKIYGSGTVADEGIVENGVPSSTL